MNPKSIAAVVLLATLAGVAGMQSIRLAESRADLAALQSTIDRQAAADYQADAAGLARHSQLQQDNTHAFTTNLLGLARAEAAGAAGRDADAADVRRLRSELQLLATGKAQSDADAAARRDLGDQYGKLVALVDGGVRSVGQLRAVVGRGIEVVSRRDAEVSALKGQVNADRAAASLPP